jgi:4'-phosphopantetheinyl transferase EntD
VVAGSISHTEAIAIAVVARKEQVSAIGVDLEASDSVKSETWPEIFQPSELAALESLPDSTAIRLATAMFSLKEAFYKQPQYPQTRQWLDFNEVAISIEPNGSACIVRTSRPSTFEGREHREFQARFRTGDRPTLAIILWPDATTRSRAE